MELISETGLTLDRRVRCLPRGYLFLRFLLALVGVCCLGSAAAKAAELTAGSLEAQSNLNSVSSLTSSDEARFASRHVLLLNMSPHPLMKQVGTVLEKRLTQFPQIERLESLTASESSGQKLEATSFAPGSRAPDLVFRIDMDTIDESGWFSRDLKAVITAELGTSPWRSSHSYVDSSTPPIVEFHWSATLNHQSTRKGIELPKYRSVASNIANEFSKAITNQLVKLHTDHGTLPLLPDSLYGPYKAPPSLPFLEKVKAKQVFSQFGLLTHNQTFWRFDVAPDPVPLLSKMVDQLKGEEWKVETVQLTNTASYFIRAKQGNARLEIFNPRDAGIRHIGELKPGPMEFIVEYREHFSRGEREAAFDKLLDDATTPTETLMLFEHSFSRQQRQRFNELVQKGGASSPQAYLSLARMHLSRKETNNAIADLEKAQALLTTLPNPSATEAKIRNIGKEISPEEQLDLSLTADTYRAVGFLEITNRQQAFSLEKKTGEPLLFFSSGPNGKLRTFCLRLQPVGGKATATSYQWTCLQTEPGIRSQRSSSFSLANQKHWAETLSHGNYILKVSVTPLESDKGFRYDVTLEGGD